jgi:hypothetical protein
MNTGFDASHCFGRFALAGSIAVVALAGSLCAQSLVFSNLSSTTGLTLSGSAATPTTLDGTVLRLAAATTSDHGGTFASAQRTVSGGFSTAFEFRLSNRGGISDGVAAGADGFVFVLQRVSASALGGTGELMGYGGIGTASLGIEFDTFLNSNHSDPSSNHLGIDLNGLVDSAATANISAADFDNGSKWTGWIDYTGTAIEVRVSTTGVRPGSPNLSYAISPATMVSTLGGSSAYVGFTAATGGAYANHDIIDWTFSDSYVPGGVTPGSPIPEPASCAMLAGTLALALAGWRRARHRRDPAGRFAA